MTIQREIKKLLNRKEVVKTVPKSKAKPAGSREDTLKKMGFPETPKHRHAWKPISKMYAPPANLNITAGNVNMPERVLEKAMFGVTTILWECVCGEIKQEEILGSDDDMLESLINKADKIGPQFIERNGKSYIISEWKPQTQNPNMIPIK